MTLAARTVTLPTNPGASWDDFAWDPKYPGDDLDYVLDCADWLTDAGRVIESATAQTSPGLAVIGSDFGVTGNAKTSIILELSGGIPLTVAQIVLALTLDDGRVVNVLIALPIRAGLPSGLIPYVPTSTGELTIGGTIITIGGDAIAI